MPAVASNIFGLSALRVWPLVTTFVSGNTLLSGLTL